VPDAERCRKASREGTSRVFEARGGDKPGLLAHPECRPKKHPGSDAYQESIYHYSGHREHFRWNLGDFTCSSINGVSERYSR